MGRSPFYSWVEQIRQYFIDRAERKQVKCNDFCRGDEDPTALCEGTGHYLCRECTWLNRENSEMYEKPQKYADARTL